MPQLDIVTFSTQIIWTTFSFIIMYYYGLEIILPLESRISKIRSKKNDLFQTKGSFLEKEVNFIFSLLIRCCILHGS